MRKWIGVDLGGTNVKLGVVDEQGKIVHQVKEPTCAVGDPDKVIQQIIQLAKKTTEQANLSWQEIEGVGIGLPGFLDIEKGIIKSLTNLFWKDVPIQKRLEEAWQKPVRIENDANAAALGEAWCGAGKGISHLVCITLGTGVGGGVIVDGKLVHGINNSAGEIGHIVVDRQGYPCNCGKTGCLETISSATGIVRMAQEAVKEKGNETILSRMKTIDTRTVFEAAKQGDQTAKEIIDRAVDALAEVLSTLTVVLNPARFVIGGGVSNVGDDLFYPLRTAFAQKADPYAKEGVEILSAALGNDAGIIGAAGLFAKEATIKKG